MKRKSRGQSLVEFALVFPVIILVLFATIDFGYWTYGWAEVQFAARRGAEQASKLQPREYKTEVGYQSDATDPCLNSIFKEAARSGALSNATNIQPADIYISYYANGASNTALTASGASDKTFKKPGNIVQVRVQKSLAPLTPFGQVIWSGSGGKFNFTSISRRTIVTNGPSYTLIVDNANLNNCTYN